MSLPQTPNRCLRQWGELKQQFSQDTSLWSNSVDKQWPCNALTHALNRINSPHWMGRLYLPWKGVSTTRVSLNGRAPKILTAKDANRLTASCSTCVRASGRSNSPRCRGVLSIVWRAVRVDGVSPNRASFEISLVLGVSFQPTSG